MKTRYLLATAGILVLTLLALADGVNSEILAYKLAIKAESDVIRVLSDKLNTAMDERNALVQVIEEMTATPEDDEVSEQDDGLRDRAMPSVTSYNDLPEGAYWLVQINTRSRVLILNPFENVNASTLVKVELPLSCKLPVHTGSFVKFENGKCQFHHGANY